MTRTLKMFGISLVAALLFSAVSAASAFAWFDWEGEAHPTSTASALGIQVFGGEAEELSCKTLAFSSGEVDGAEITGVPTYGECTYTAAETSLEAKVDSNGCELVFHTDGKFELECPTGKQIEITVKALGIFRPCVDVDAQTPKTPTVSFTNQGTGASRDIHAAVEASGIKYERTGVCGSASLENGSYIGEITIKGDSGGKQVGIWWTEH